VRLGWPHHSPVGARFASSGIRLRRLPRIWSTGSSPGTRPPRATCARRSCWTRSPVGCSGCHSAPLTGCCANRPPHVRMPGDVHLRFVGWLGSSEPVLLVGRWSVHPAIAMAAGAAGNDVRSDTGRPVEEFAMTDMPDPPGRTDDKTTEDAGQDLTGPREVSHPTPGMTRRSRTSKTSRPARRSVPITRPIPAVLSTDHARPGTRSNAVLASLGAMHGWIAGPPLRRRQCIYRERSACRRGHVRLGQQCALKTWGRGFRSVCPSRSSSPSCARTTWMRPGQHSVTRSSPTDRSARAIFLAR
jgi:hypothetical protein